jgi:L-lactate dehydrogenase complex protein LldE
MPEPTRVALFVTCLVDFFRPNVGFAAVSLLRDAGCRIEVPGGQACCGQPAFNNGDLTTARAIARQVIETFADYELVVTPSGSCGGMLRLHYPELFADDPEWQRRALGLAGRCRELVEFLDQQGLVSSADYPGRVTYHDSCSGLRELGLREQPRRLLEGVTGLELCELPDAQTCCGFGGTFCVKYPDISGRMVDDKVDAVQASGADTLLAGDLGCLLNIAGRLRRRGLQVRVFHIAEVLAGMAAGPGIGGASE